MPVGTHAAPMALVIPVESAQAVPVHANSAEAAPYPFVSAMQMVIVVVASVQVPVTSHVVPASSIPAPEDTQAVSMPANFPVMVGPEPTRLFVVMVSSPQVPICANTTPVSLMIAIQRAKTIQMNTYASEASPDPLVPAM